MKIKDIDHMVPPVNSQNVIKEDWSSGIIIYFDMPLDKVEKAITNGTLEIPAYIDGKWDGTNSLRVYGNDFASGYGSVDEDKNAFRFVYTAYDNEIRNVIHAGKATLNRAIRTQDISVIKDAGLSKKVEDIKSAFTEAGVNVENVKVTLRNSVGELTTKLDESLNGGTEMNEDRTYTDVHGGFGEPGEKINFKDIKKYWDDNFDTDPCLQEYDSFEDWFKETKQNYLTDADESLRESVNSDIVSMIKKQFPQATVKTSVRKHSDVHKSNPNTPTGKTKYVDIRITPDKASSVNSILQYCNHNVKKVLDSDSRFDYYGEVPARNPHGSKEVILSYQDCSDLSDDEYNSLLGESLKESIEPLKSYKDAKQLVKCIDNFIKGIEENGVSAQYFSGDDLDALHKGRDAIVDFTEVYEENGFPDTLNQNVEYKLAFKPVNDVIGIDCVNGLINVVRSAGFNFNSARKIDDDYYITIICKPNDLSRAKLAIENCGFFKSWLKSNESIKPKSGKLALVNESGVYRFKSNK